MSVFLPYRFYSKTAIEYRASRLLRQMQSPQTAVLWPLDATVVADFLDLGVVWDRIEPDESGAIAARILPKQRLIEINEEILDKPQGFQESTLAHEIGHWVLHVNHQAAERTEDPSDPDADLFVCRGNSNISQLESIEWQAQYFAGSLLMPRHILAQKIQGRDLLRWSHLYEIREELGVSISNLVKRLQDLGWIYVDKGSRTIYPGTAVVNGEMRLFG
ncbi:ImmA/IrrE family metallo-endopeptidase [[Phormidium] sp. ETS-05]|uniref:ImmA/IrrE family metallo-endopeptidase n=1 Tax=[Phormidium] sp. ETS-05 TaxID=222819 RepID=UPI0018EEFBCF|nr:ImmA/IrrE family metallo-endopeptidase [[Phormidium] sp. ETS-05]